MEQGIPITTPLSVDAPIRVQKWANKLYSKHSTHADRDAKLTKAPAGTVAKEVLDSVLRLLHIAPLDEPVWTVKAQSLRFVGSDGVEIREDVVPDRRAVAYASVGYDDTARFCSRGMHIGVAGVTSCYDPTTVPRYYYLLVWVNNEYWCIVGLVDVYGNVTNNIAFNEAADAPGIYYSLVPDRVYAALQEVHPKVGQHDRVVLRQAEGLYFGHRH